MTTVNQKLLQLNPNLLVSHIKQLGHQLGFTHVRIAHLDTARAATLLQRWQQLNNEGDMHYLQRHGQKRGNIRTIAPDAISIISVSLSYLADDIKSSQSTLDSSSPYLSVYARNRDYHKIMRKRLKQFAKAIEELIGKQLKTRAFVDTAPVLDKAYAEESGVGWLGKHGLILDDSNGSFHFLGELAVNIKLPADHAVKPRCGSCSACIDVCPTQAIIAPYQLDAEKCISYLTIEYDGVIADHFKTAIGNRIYGCDDCQLFCPWNRYSQITSLLDFHARECFKTPDYPALFSWNENTFLKNTEGSPIRRIGHNRWQRNLAIGMGNVLRQPLLDNSNKAYIRQLLSDNNNPHHAVQDAVNWALGQQTSHR